jgi:hypothetical protein
MQHQTALRGTSKRSLIKITSRKRGHCMAQIYLQCVCTGVWHGLNLYSRCAESDGNTEMQICTRAWKIKKLWKVFYQRVARVAFHVYDYQFSVQHAKVKALITPATESRDKLTGKIMYREPHRSRSQRAATPDHAPFYIFTKKFWASPQWWWAKWCSQT